jgi:hypothetical protein
MILIDHVNWNTPGIKKDRMEKGVLGSALAFVIDDELVEVLPVDQMFAELLINAKSFEDTGVVVDGLYGVHIMNDKTIIDTLVCQEKLWAILLSSPYMTVLPGTYKYGNIAVPGWKFINNEFVLPGVYE